MYTLPYRNDNPSPAATEEGLYVYSLTYMPIIQAFTYTTIIVRPTVYYCALRSCSNG